MKIRDLTFQFSRGAFGLQPRQTAEIIRACNRDAGSPLAPKRPGPGGGPGATPINTTRLILAALSGEQHISSPAAAMRLYAAPLSGNDEAEEFQPGLIPETIPAKPTHALTRCGITGAVCLGDAVVAIFANPTLAETIDRIEVRQGNADASLYARDGRVSRFVSFADRLAIDAGDAAGTFRKVAIVGGVVLAEVAREIAR